MDNETLLPECIRPEDIPRTFYRGMWLWSVSEGQGWGTPFCEVLTVGRRTAKFWYQHRVDPCVVSIENAKKHFRKVYLTRVKEDVVPWIKPGAVFSLPGVGKYVIRHVRGVFLSAVNQDQGTLAFFLVLTVRDHGIHLPNTWDRLLSPHMESLE